MLKAAIAVSHILAKATCMTAICGPGADQNLLAASMQLHVMSMIALQCPVSKVTNAVAEAFHVQARVALKFAGHAHVHA